MKNDKDIYAEFKEAGLVTGSHASDLYVKHCPKSLEIAERHGKTGVLLTVFKNQVSNEYNYELPFCYSPFWECDESATSEAK